MAEADDFGRIADLLGQACEAVGSSLAPADGRGGHTDSCASEAKRRDERGDMARAIAIAWPEVVGPEVAANTSPVRIKSGRLTVSASSSVWAHTLQYMTADLAHRLNERLGSDVIEHIVFRHAGWEEAAHASGVGAADRQSTFSGAKKLSDDEREALARVEELDIPEPLKQAIARAMRASFVRAQRGSVR